MIVRKPYLRASEIMQQRVKNKENIEILFETNTLGLFGENVSELNRQQVYMILKNLSARHIIDFIPRRKPPYISCEEELGDPIEWHMHFCCIRGIRCLKKLQRRGWLQFANLQILDRDSRLQCVILRSEVREIFWESRKVAI